ncbi:MAG: zf-HC2 domain-containing protein [Acidimicrobiales bacterium]
MSAPRCDHWQGLLAMAAIGRLNEGEAIALNAHLEGCPECRGLTAPLASAGRALDLVNLAQLDDPVPDEFPAGLAATVFRRIRAEQVTEQMRHRRVAVLVSTAAALLAAAAVFSIALADSPPGPKPRVATFAALPGVRASASLRPSATGTVLSLQESGQPLDRSFTVSMESRSGKWWNAGSYSTSASSESVQLSCAAPAGAISTIWVQDSAGRTVMRAYLS